ncbi:MAG: glycosyltransferase family 4 protein [Gaiellaceae bacterium]
MRVLLATDWPPFEGGAEGYLLQLRDGLRASGEEVALLASDVGRGRREADYPVRSSDSALAKSLLQLSNPFATVTARKALRGLRPEVAHVGMFELYLSPSLLRALQGVPFVLTILYYKPICPNGLKLLPDDTLCEVEAGLACLRGGCLGPAHWLRDQLRYRGIDRAVARASAILTCSRWMERRLGEAGLAARFLPHPVPPPEPGFERRPSERPLVVYSGRLAREKGLPLLLRALRRARDTGADLRLRIVGDGPERSRVERLVEELQLGAAVELTGWVASPRVSSLLADAWALVAPSLWAEPLGINGLEGAVRGIPLIASRHGGYAETVAECGTGRLVANRDEDDLTRALLELAAGHEAPSLPESARASLERRHDPRAHLEALRALYSELVA